MNVVVDENVGYGLVEKLCMGEYHVISISELAERGMSDEDIYTLTLKEQAILVTAQQFRQPLIRQSDIIKEEVTDNSRTNRNKDRQHVH